MTATSSTTRHPHWTPSSRPLTPAPKCAQSVFSTNIGKHAPKSSAEPQLLLDSCGYSANTAFSDCHPIGRVPVIATIVNLTIEYSIANILHRHLSPVIRTVGRTEQSVPTAEYNLAVDGEVRAKKPSLTLNLGTNGLKVTSEPPPMAGQAGRMQGQDRSAVTCLSSSHARRCLFWLSCDNRRTMYRSCFCKSDHEACWIYGPFHVIGELAFGSLGAAPPSLYDGRLQIRMCECRSVVGGEDGLVTFHPSPSSSYRTDKDTLNQQLDNIDWSDV
ncbi:hypothetical protein J6590_084474 [Homalodisca vitripennis]|nr:hypothetical protein J6590_084474 [Homalodisca vitripennis]